MNEESAEPSSPEGLPASGSAAGPGRVRRPRMADAIGSPFFWRGVLPLIDTGLIFACVVFVGRQRLGHSPGEFMHDGTLPSFLIFTASLLVGAAVSGAYRKPHRLRSLSAAAEFILGVSLGTLAAMFVIYVVFFGEQQRVAQESRSVLLLAAALFIPVSLGIRMVFERVLEKLSRDRPYLLIGKPRSLSEFSETYKFIGLGNPTVSMPLSDVPEGAGDPGLEPGSPAFWNEVGRQFEGIVLTDPPEEIGADLIDRLVRMHFTVLPVFTLNSFYANAWRQVPTLNLNAAWVFEQDFSLAERSYYRFVKRIFDVFFSFSLLVAFLPLMVLLAVLVKLDSAGPVFYRQSRVGQNRRVFTIYKYRTMQEKSDEGPDYTGLGDARVTRMGRIIRRLRLDELPQLLNVVRGDMSLIGPRPEWSRLAARYEKEIPFYHLRHLVKPGVTGWAQLNITHGASIRGTLEKLRYDLYYIQFYSPVLDLEIFLKTILHVVSFKGR